MAININTLLIFYFLQIWKLKNTEICDAIQKKENMQILGYLM